MTNTFLKENQAVRLHVDRGVLRDIIEARITQDKRRSYYTIGSVFSGMGFTLVAMGSTNYTAASVFVLLGVFYYLCIVGANVNYVAEEEEDWKAPAKFKYYGEDTDDDLGEEEAEEKNEEGHIEFCNLSSLTMHEKMVLFRSVFEELSGFEMTDADVAQILRSHGTAESHETETSTPSDTGLTVIEEASSEEETEAPADAVVAEPEQEGPRLARAETSYSQTEEIAPVQPINLDIEEVTGVQTPEASSEVN